MDKLSNTTTKGVLPEFQEFLLIKNLVPEKNAPFYAYWVGKFLNYARQRQLPTGEYQEPAVIEFLEALKTDKPISDWQHRQAVDAIRLYFFHYRGQTKNKLTTDVPAENVSQIKTSSAIWPLNSVFPLQPKIRPSTPFYSFFVMC